MASSISDRNSQHNVQAREQVPAYPLQFANKGLRNDFDLVRADREAVRAAVQGARYSVFEQKARGN